MYDIPDFEGTQVDKVMMVLMQLGSRPDSSREGSESILHLTLLCLEKVYVWSIMSLYEVDSTNKGSHSSSFTTTPIIFNSYKLTRPNSLYVHYTSFNVRITNLLHVNTDNCCTKDPRCLFTEIEKSQLSFLASRGMIRVHLIRKQSLEEGCTVDQIVVILFSGE